MKSSFFLLAVAAMCLSFAGCDAQQPTKSAPDLQLQQPTKSASDLQLVGIWLVEKSDPPIPAEIPPMIAQPASIGYRKFYADGRIGFGLLFKDREKMHKLDFGTRGGEKVNFITKDSKTVAMKGDGTNSPPQEIVLIEPGVRFTIKEGRDNKPVTITYKFIDANPDLLEK